MYLNRGILECSCAVMRLNIPTLLIIISIKLEILFKSTPFSKNFAFVRFHYWWAWFIFQLNCHCLHWVLVYNRSCNQINIAPDDETPPFDKKTNSDSKTQGPLINGIGRIFEKWRYNNYSTFNPWPKYYVTTLKQPPEPIDSSSILSQSKNKKKQTITITINN